MAMPKLTVLMPVYNARQFLNEAIESILSQTFTDFEFIIIDDCSTDDSAAIILSYKDSRIRFYKNEMNMGISKTLNRGIELSETEWIARMDSDDISYPDRLEQQYNFILANPDGALYSCWVKVIDEHGKFIRQDNFRSEYYYYNLTFICWIYHPTVIYKKSAVQEVGMYTVAYAEDFELFWQLSRRFKIFNLSEVLLDYRVTSQSLHQVLKKNEYEEAQKKQILRNIRYYTDEQVLVMPEVIDCLQHNFTPLLKKNKVTLIVTCLAQLKTITQFILEKENVNRNITAIKEAAFYKRKFIVSYFVKHLSWLKAIHLLWRLNEYKLLKKYIRSSFKKQVRYT
jgi:glycosyltransferase involved in cell wall biosynthesis